MQAIEMVRINLSEYRPNTSLSFSGRPQGVDVRKKLRLDEFDNNDEEAKLIIPADTTSFNPSFFLGLLYDSISKLGMDRFKSKYLIEFETKNPEQLDALKRNISDGFRNASNSLNRKSGLGFF